MARPREIVDFLSDIWGFAKKGEYVFISTLYTAKNEVKKTWADHPIHIDEISLKLQLYSLLKNFPTTDFDLYFCPLSFKSPKRRKENVSQTVYLFQDLDEASPTKIKPKPSIYWETSPKRYQGLWRLSSSGNYEQLNKDLAYHTKADKSGWDYTQVLRIPGSYNHKEKYNKPKVKLLHKSDKIYDPKKLRKIIPKSQSITSHPEDVEIPSIPSTRSDNEVIDLILNGPETAIFKKMVNGKITIGDKKNNDFDSVSRLEWRFCKILVHYTQDFHQIDRIYKNNTKLKWIREEYADPQNKYKWTERFDSYVVPTIKKVIKEELNGKKVEDIWLIRGPASVKILYPQLAKNVLKKTPCIILGERIYTYKDKDGVFDQDGENLLRRRFTKILEKEGVWMSKNENELVHYVYSLLNPDVPAINPDDGCIVVNNGILNLKTLTLSEFTQDRISTQKIPITYDPDAKCPKFKKFINQVMYKDTIPFVFEYLGYMLTPSTVEEHAVAFEGPGGNGKSVLLSIIKWIIGEDNISSVDPADMVKNKGNEVDKFSTFNLINKVANIVTDISSKPIESDRLKMIISGERIQVQEKYKPSFFYSPTAKHIYGCNTFPRLIDSAPHSSKRRWSIVPFNKVNFTDGQGNTEMRNKEYWEEEFSGIFNIILEGLKRYQKQGKFSKSKTINNRMDIYLEEIDSLTAFLKSQTVRSPKGKIEKNFLYQQYKSWCIGLNLNPINEGKFQRKITQEHHYINKDAKINGKRCYQGIELKTEID